MSLGQMNLALTLTSVNVNDITEIDISIEKIFDNYGEAKNFLDKSLARMSIRMKR